MGTQVTAAIVAGVVSLLVTFGKIAWDAWADKRERRLTARAELDRYREPLLSAVNELGNRIDNILNDHYLSYYLNTERQQTALRSTSYRIGAYFAWTEILFGDSGQYRFAADPATEAVNDTLGWVGSTFADDQLDQGSGGPESSRLMVWREEQRGIGELMRKPGESPACVGYSTFIKNYEDCYAAWFTRFEADLESMFSPDEAELQSATSPDESEPVSQRLARLQGVLAKLLIELDIDKSVVKPEERKPKWAQPSRYPKLPE